MQTRHTPIGEQNTPKPKHYINSYFIIKLFLTQPFEAEIRQSPAWSGKRDITGVVLGFRAFGVEEILGM